MGGLSLVTLTGRIGRKTWWLGILAVGALRLLVGGAVPMLLGRPAAHGDLGTAALIQIIITAAFIWPWTVLAAKRLHDRDLSAVWLTIPWGLWLLRVGLLVADGAATPGRPRLPAPDALTPGSLVGAMQFLVWLGFLVVLGFLAGTPGPNRYGPSPKSDVDETAVFD